MELSEPARRIAPWKSPSSSIKASLMDKDSIIDIIKRMGAKQHIRTKVNFLL